jgi:hypothetical protein
MTAAHQDQRVGGEGVREWVVSCFGGHMGYNDVSIEPGCLISTLNNSSQ